MERENVIVVDKHFPCETRFKLGTHFFRDHLVRKGCRVLNLVLANTLLDLLKPNNVKHRLPLFIKYRTPSVIEETEVGSYTVCGITTLFHNLTAIPAAGDFAIRRSFQFSHPSIERVIRPWGKADVLLFNITQAAIYYQIKPKLAILRVQDVWDSLYERVNYPAYRSIMKQVDVILAVSQPIYEFVVSQRGTSQGVYLLPNGCDTNRFLTRYPPPAEYQAISTPIAVYVGRLEEIDWSLLTYIAKEKSDMSFVLIGSGVPPENVPRNVYTIGYRPHANLPAYTQHADVGLIPYRNITHVRAAERPLKFYDYIASGLPIVSVSYGAMKAMAPHAILATNYEEFSDAIDRALEYDTQDRERLRQAANEFSWNRIFKRFDEIVASHYPG